MQNANIKVSYRDKESNPPKNVPLGAVEVPRFDNVTEALAYFENEEGEGRGESALLSYIHTAYDIEKQRIFRDANRPDREKTVSNVSKIKQLSKDKQEDLLRAAGLLE